MRQMMAFSLFFVAIKFANDKKFIMYIVFIALAYLMHQSSMILIIFYPLLLLFKKGIIDTRVQLILFVLSHIIPGDSFINYLFSYVDKALLLYGDFGERYLNDNVAMDYRIMNFGARSWIITILNLIIILSSRKMYKRFVPSLFPIIYNLYFIGLILYQLFIFNHHIQRFVYYLYSFGFIIFSYGIVYMFRKERKNYEYIMGIIMLLLFLLYFAVQLISDDGTGHTLYQFYR